MSKRVLMIPGGGMDNGSARTRMYSYLHELAARGLKVFVASYTYHKYDRPGAQPLRGWRRLILELVPLRGWLELLRADIVWHQKFSGSPLLLALASLLGKRIVYDLDDAIYLPTPFTESNAVWTEKQRHSVGHAMRRASAVVVSGEEIAAFARQFNRNVRIIPTVVETTAGTPSSPSDKLVIGWVGAPENQRYLMRLEDILLRLQQELPELEVWIVTSKLISPPPRFRHKFIPWSRQAEAETVPQFTTGLAPLDDTEWCRAKLNYKALVYMSFGVPAIVSPVGFPMADFAAGESVRYARNDEEWYTAIKDMILDRAARDCLALNALRTLNEKYTARSHADDLTAVLTGA